MSNNKHDRSSIWTTSKGMLQSIVNDSKSYKEILDKLEGDRYSSGSSYYVRLKQRLSDDDIDMSIFEENMRNNKKNCLYMTLAKKNPIPNDIVFSSDSKTGRYSVKQRIINHNLIPYKCACCNVVDTYNGKPISLHLDHINGVNNDNRLENLRFLCPNCHSQTDTYAGKSRKIKNFCSCGKSIAKKSIKCKKCTIQTTAFANFIPKKKFDPTTEELQTKLTEMNWNWTKTGKHYNVTGNAIKRRCKKLGIVSPKTKTP